jgi:DNA-binding transcriptional ArsR family regulator
LEERVADLERRVAALERLVREVGLREARAQWGATVLGLPASVAKSLTVLEELGEATASEVAEHTGRSRSIENIYLNELVRLGYVGKRRVGRKIYFRARAYY